jgi:hypothetical protein
VPEVGRDGERSVRSASGLATSPRRGAGPRGPASLEQAVRGWEKAYRDYGRLSEPSVRSRQDDPSLAGRMASASRSVADGWRGIASCGELPWWCLAAVESAAQAFHAQAREWEVRGFGEGSASGQDFVRGAES